MQCGNSCGGIQNQDLFHQGRDDKPVVITLAAHHEVGDSPPWIPISGRQEVILGIGAEQSARICVMAHFR